MIEKDGLDPAIMETISPPTKPNPETYGLNEEATMEVDV